jgi:hypothetical protein
MQPPRTAPRPPAPPHPRTTLRVGAPAAAPDTPTRGAPPRTKRLTHCLARAHHVAATTAGPSRRRWWRLRGGRNADGWSGRHEGCRGPEGCCDGLGRGGVRARRRGRGDVVDAGGSGVHTGGRGIESPVAHWAKSQSTRGFSQTNTGARSTMRPSVTLRRAAVVIIALSVVACTGRTDETRSLVNDAAGLYGGRVLPTNTSDFVQNTQLIVEATTIGVNSVGISTGWEDNGSVVTVTPVPTSATPPPPSATGMELWDITLSVDTIYKNSTAVEVAEDSNIVLRVFGVVPGDCDQGDSLDGVYLIDDNGKSFLYGLSLNPDGSTWDVEYGPFGRFIMTGSSVTDSNCQPLPVAWASAENLDPDDFRDEIVHAVAAEAAQSTSTVTPTETTTPNMTNTTTPQDTSPGVAGAAGVRLGERDGDLRVGQGRRFRRLALRRPTPDACPPSSRSPGIAAASDPAGDGQPPVSGCAGWRGPRDSGAPRGCPSPG